ncbi:hypothetical protein Mnod_7907 (plasmid) [Methylobacterium nodulans ORS 2060]|uniref:Uncharacterized protein n=1 Tax=Methylobacterium nodulans (strain LMG 21967 / CNCM I-2342 / ORS 2060) TaxID=460265 RepID=B8IWM6_METNO|nr:hypothetical protein Mnod_7907 [Methylobacterium nodulans ORS 2060]
MRVLGPIVLAQILLLMGVQAEVSVRGRIGAALVRHQHLRRRALLLDQLAKQLQGRLLVALGLNQQIQRDDGHALALQLRPCTARHQSDGSVVVDRTVIRSRRKSRRNPDIDARWSPADARKALLWRETRKFRPLVIGSCPSIWGKVPTMFLCQSKSMRRNEVCENNPKSPTCPSPSPISGGPLERCPIRLRRKHRPRIRRPRRSCGPPRVRSACRLGG